MKTNSIAPKDFNNTRGQRSNTRLLGLAVVITLLAVVFTFGALASSTSRTSPSVSAAQAFAAPVIACPTNVALSSYGSTATASSQYNANYPASGVIDGEHNGNNWGAGGGWSDGTRSVYPDNVQVNFRIDQPIQEIDVYTLKNQPNNGSVVNDTTPATSYGITSFNVQYWTGAAWVDVPGGAITGNTLAKRKIIFPTITTDRIRVVVNDSADHLYSRIVEIEAFSCTPTTIRCVNPGGEDGCFSSIQAAINASNPGDVINVDSGFYQENLTLSKRLILRSPFAGRSACGRNEDEANIFANSGTVLTLQTGSAGSIIDGFSFTGGSRGIESISGPLDKLQILNNRIVSFTGSGIFLSDPGSDITISQNAVDGGSKVGGGDLVHLDPDTFNGFYLTNNCITNGAAVGNGTGFLVDGNRNVGPSATRNPLISGNLFNNNQNGANLGIRSLNTGTIRGNTFSNSRLDGMQGGPKNSLITGNTFTANGRNGLTLTSFGNFTGDPSGGAQQNTVTCNNITFNGLNQSVGGGSGLSFGTLQAPGTISSNHINLNNITNNHIGATYTGSETIDAENNWWGAADGPSGAYGGSGDSVSSTKIDAVPFLTSDASCATLTTSPANQQGWLAQVTSTDGLAQFVGSPPFPIFGAGSLRLFTGTHGDESAQFRNSSYDGTNLSAVTSLGYCTYVTQWNGAQVPYLILNVDRDNNGSVDDLLFFEPEYSKGTYTAAIPAQQAPALNTWQCWQAFRGGWYAIDADTGDPTFGGPGAGVLPFSDYVTANPNAVLRNTTRGAVRIVSGFASPGDVYNSYTDFFRIGVGSSQTVFDFEPAP